MRFVTSAGVALLLTVASPASSAGQQTVAVGPGVRDGSPEILEGRPLFLTRVNPHLRYPFASGSVLPDASGSGAGVTYHIPRSTVELFAEGRRLFFQRNVARITWPTLDVVYSAGVSLHWFRGRGERDSAPY
jgi:hypothetical protein